MEEEESDELSSDESSEIVVLNTTTTTTGGEEEKNVKDQRGSHIADMHIPFLETPSVDYGKILKKKLEKWISKLTSQRSNLFLPPPPPEKIHNVFLQKLFVYKKQLKLLSVFFT